VYHSDKSKTYANAINPTIIAKSFILHAISTAALVNCRVAQLNQKEIEGNITEI
jgi:hypothetical protein